jgi:c-di-GMP-binding flagellar brake protein YcgR
MRNKGSEKAHFDALNEKNADIVFRKLVRLKANIILWEKSHSETEEFQVNSFNQDLKIIHASGKSLESNLVNKELLFKTQADGIHYFGECVLNQGPRGLEFYIKIQKNLYKCERRKNFRLKLYSSDKIEISFRMDNLALPKSEIPVQRGNQTSLFHDFLNYVEKSQLEDTPRAGEAIRHLIRDISATGLSFWISKNESYLFQPGENLKEIKIFFKEDECFIPEATIVYCIPLSDEIQEEITAAIQKGRISEQKHDLKVALNFTKIDAILDSKIQELINKQMRIIRDEKEFEDFLS